MTVCALVCPMTLCPQNSCPFFPLTMTPTFTWPFLVLQSTSVYVLGLQNFPDHPWMKVSLSVLAGRAQGKAGSQEGSEKDFGSLPPTITVHAHCRQTMSQKPKSQGSRMRSSLHTPRGQTPGFDPFRKPGVTAGDVSHGGDQAPERRIHDPRIPGAL